MAKPKTFRTAFDEYRSTGQIGQGASGYVVEATNTAGEQVAIKYLNPAKVHPEPRKRFQNEIRFGQRIGHANVMPILDVGEVEISGVSTPFYVMPRYELPLRAFVPGRMPPDKVLSTFGKILDGVEAAHLNGVWHRDLKPENILVSGDLVRVAVADFGIAYFSDPDLYEAAKTKVADRMANFRYCAPEQAVPGSKRDATVDIYALGLMLNEFFTGEVPRGAGFRTIGSVAPGLAYLDPIVERMIQQEPAKRFQSIDRIKVEITSRGQQELLRQRLDGARKVVVPTTDPPDPLLVEPIKIVATDWENRRLRLTLSAEPPHLWRQLFTGTGYDSMQMGSSPEYAQINGKILTIPSDEMSASKVLEQYKRHIPRTNKSYEEKVRVLHAGNLEKQKREAKAAADAAETRLRVLSQLKLD